MTLDYAIAAAVGGVLTYWRKCLALPRTCAEPERGNIDLEVGNGNVEER